ncbi:MAG: hypothetical protein JXR73_17975 [Candidatus Omnitrophica bacterium]|nr:hypothetical protein [Candidatus Omnitrophota bacterium]
MRRHVCFEMFWIIFIVGVMHAIQPAYTQNRPADFSEDGRVGVMDLYYLLPQWRAPEIGGDLNQDQKTDGADLLQLKSQWHDETDTANPYKEGRAVGIHAITQQGGEKWSSGELEIDILNRSQAKTLQRSKPDDPEALSPARLPSNQLMFELIQQCADELDGRRSSTVRPQADGIQYGTAYPDIGTFWNWSIWAGWGANFSETYTPEGEAYNWVIHFAPEAIYVSLQNAKFNYSSVDVFAGVYSFWGAIVSPDGDRLRSSYLNDLLSIGISLNLSIKVIPFGPSPNAVVSKGVSFYREGAITNLQRAIQFSTGLSTSFELIPLPIDIPISVSLDHSEPGFGFNAGFYPIIIWDLDEEGAGNPVDSIVEGLEQIAGDESTAYKNVAAQQFASMVLPLMTHMSSESTSANAAYFIQFLQNNSLTGSGGEGTIDGLISEAEEWLQTGDASQLPEEVKKAGEFDFPVFYEYMKGVQSGAQMGFELGYIRGYESSGRTDTIYADGLVIVPCAVGDWCYMEVSAEEISELIPGSSPGDFEGVPVYFDNDPLTYLNTEGTETSSIIRDGIAWHEFLYQSNSPVIVGVRISKSDNPYNKYIELKRRKVIPEERAYIYANEKAVADEVMTLRTAALDENGLPLIKPATVTFYDSRGYLLGGPVKTQEGIASIELIPRPTIPEIDSFLETQIGYTEEDAEPGYALEGRGFSKDADVWIDGVSVNERSDWIWQVISSQSILFLPPNEQSLLTQPSRIQVVNPKNIASEEFLFTP